MKTKLHHLPLALNFFLLHSTLCLSVRAQNTTFTYQGLVTSGGTNFTGTGQFQFALVTSSNVNHTALAVANYTGPTITSYNVVYPGNGYVTAPAVTITGGGGSGATAMASLSGGSVLNIFPLNPGSGYTYPPQVTVAAPPANINYTTYWSNDGTSVNGSEPATNVTVAVTNGLFTVVLGDTTVAHMAAISAALFSQPNLQLRIWFNDGTHGFATLNPLQNLTPTPYAVYAANAGTATDATSVAAANIVGTIPVTQLPTTIITNGASGVNISGTFSGNGTGVTNVALSTLNGVSWGYFLLAASPAAGDSAFFVCAADVNGDGHPDLISVNVNDDTLTVLTNNGSGVFGSNATLNVGHFPDCVIAADVNGDGHVDLVTANFGDTTLTVLTNNGSGIFGFNATLIVGSEPESVVAADVNGDGHVDLISANYGSEGSGNTLTVLTNNGFGVFGSNATLIVGGGPDKVIAADVNGDGKPDLISANQDDGTLTVLTNNGFGVFGSNATLNVGGYPDCVIAADVNGDGKVDLISRDAGINTLTVLTNNGFGMFGSNATLNVGNGPNCVIAADVNGDGHVDLITANYTDSSLTVLTNNGFGSFGFNATLSVGSFPVWVTAADVNGDGHVDLISANSGNHTLSVLLNVPSFSGSFSGSGLPNVNAVTLNGLSANNFWQTSGNAGTSPGANFLGTTDYQPLEILAGAGVGINTNDPHGEAFFVNGKTLVNGTAVFNGNVGIGNVGIGKSGGPESELTVLQANAGGRGAELSLVNPAASTVGNEVAINFGTDPSTYNGDTPNAQIKVRNVNAGNNASDMVFSTWDGSGFAERMRLQSGGNVGIGTANPLAPLTVNGSVIVDAGGQNNGFPIANGLTFGGLTGEGIGSVRTSGNSDQNGLNFYTDYTKRLTILNNGNVGIGTTTPDALLSVNGGADKPGGGSWGTFSDARLKDVGANFTHGLEALADIQPVHYHYKTDNPLKLPSQPDYVGVVAQQVQAAIPEAVQRNQDGYLVVNNDPIIWTMFNAIKELKAENEALKQQDAVAQARDAEIQTLKQQNDSLAARLNELETTVKILVERK